MKKLLYLCIILLFTSSQLFAQRVVTGKVTDDKDGAPLPDVSISVKGTKTGAISGRNGEFTLTLPVGAKTIVISTLGYVTIDVPVGNKSFFNLTLVSSNRNLQEVVVTGYQVRKKRDEGGAISSVKGKEIANLPNTSIDRALQGRAAGVLVQANNGIPGGAINVRIRGTGSYLAGNQPLYIVDGVQLNTRNDGDFTQNNPLAFLNPNDIESIDVLKDAASGAIYGSQAANGVVIITTKKGKAGKTKFTFNSFIGTADPIKKFDVLNTQQYIDARTQATFNANSNTTAGYTVLNAKRTILGELANATGVGSATINAFTLAQADSMIAALPSFDWQDLAVKKGAIRNYDLSMSGGNDKTTFYLGVSNTFQSTIINKVDFNRYALNADITHKATDKLTVSTKISLSTFEQKVPFGVSGSFLGSPIFAGSLILSVNPVRNADNTYFGLPPTQALAGVLNQNIIGVNDYNSGIQRTNQMVGAFTADYKINNWLNFRSFFSLDYRLVQGNLYRDPRTNDGFGVRGRGTVESDWNTNFLTTQTINFNKVINKSKIDGLLGVEYRRDINEAISAAGIGFPSYQFTTINAAATAESVGQAWTGFKRSGVFGRVNYGYDDRFGVSAILRRDGSSRFGANNTFGWFPSVIGLWNVDNEKFMDRVKFISTLRLRGSWGQTGGDQIGNFDSRSLFGAGLQYNQSAGINYTQLGNPDIRWERNQTINLGLDYGFLNNRLSGSVEVYQRLTNDLLLPRPVTWQTGVSSFTQNVGTLENRGIEFGLNAEIIRPKTTDGFRWNMSFNFAFNYNTVRKLYDGLQVLPGDPSFRVGRSINSVFTQVYSGVNPATGRPAFIDTFNNTTYSPQLRDRRYIGDGEADQFGGLTNTFSWKGFSLDVLFTYQYGLLATDGQVNFLSENGNRTFNGLVKPYENAWKAPGDMTSYPRFFNGGTEPGGVNHVAGSSRLWKKADFIRVRDMRVSYDLPSNVTRRLKLSNARFYVQGQNLFTISDWAGYDPEFVGVSTGIIPQTKNFNAGIQIGF